MLYYNRKPGKRTIIERLERDRVLYARLRVKAESGQLAAKADMHTLAYGAPGQTEEAKLLVSGWVADMQSEAIKHTSEGGFSHLAAASIRV